MEALKKYYGKSSSDGSHDRILGCSRNQYFGFIKFFPILNLDLNGASNERKEASLWSALTNGSTEVSEKCSEPFRVDKKRS